MILLQTQRTMTPPSSSSRCSLRGFRALILPVVAILSIQGVLFRETLQNLFLTTQEDLIHEPPTGRMMVSRSLVNKTEKRGPIAKPLRPHPHAGALDTSGKPGYVHDVTFLKNYPVDLINLDGAVCSAPRGEGAEGKHGDQALRKIHIHQVPSNRSPKRILCAVYTHSNRHYAVRAIAETWGPRCDGFFAASNVTDPSIGAVNLLHDGEEAYGNMWNKIKAMWAYMYDHYLDDYDYFYICGDDTFVIPENLRYSVSMLSNDPEDIVFRGRKMADFPRARNSFCGGGAGYTLSRGAVKKLVDLYPTPECWPNHTASDEDRIVASCFRSIGRSCTDDVDEKDEPRYHIQDIEFHARWKFGARTPLQIQALLDFHNVVLKEGLDSISASSISFHLKGAKTLSDDRGIRRCHALLHGLCPASSTEAEADKAAAVSTPVTVPRTDLSTTPLVLDFLSIGSLSRLDFQDAQRDTFGKHPSVRYFFNVTEEDDAERDCSSNLTVADTLAISSFCRGQTWNKDSLMHYQRNHYATRAWLQGKKNAVGWLCAQKRPIHGISKALGKYRTERLPDFLVIIDDDSYYQMELVQKELLRYDSNDAHVLAGCLIRSRVMESNFTIPFGGWGTLLSRGAIANLMRPVYCQTDKNSDDFVTNACHRLEENQIGEKHLFHDGMSIGELMEAYAAAQPFAAHTSWTHGFCLHSDWALGFFFNFYFVGRHSGERPEVPHDRMAGYLGSELYAGKATPAVKAKYGQCNNKSPETCGRESHICHYQTPESMKALTIQ